MITYLTSPKPFVGRALIGQVDAIRSWLGTADGAEVILYGKAEGAEKNAKELGITWIEDIETNAKGTPLFGAIVRHAAQQGKYDFQAYINCDILLTREFADAMKKIPFDQFLMVGQRIDLKEGVIWHNAKSGWREQLMHLSKLSQISLHPPTGSDYFGFRRGLWKEVGPLAIGRGGFDNALLTFCIRRRIPVIDATPSIPAIHQFHDYGHVKGGEGEVFRGNEALCNINENYMKMITTVEDADWQLLPSGLYHSRCRGDWLRALETRIGLVGQADRGARMVNLLKIIAHKIGISRPRELHISEIYSRILGSNE